jgi:YVTN family beta-propeller protein
LYVLNDNSITVVDPTKNKVIDSMPFQGSAGGWLFVRPHFLYVGCIAPGWFGSGNFIPVIDTSRKKIIANIPMGRDMPYGGMQFVEPNLVYVGASYYLEGEYGYPRGSVIVTIDTVTNQVSNRIELGTEYEYGAYIGPVVWEPHPRLYFSGNSSERASSLYLKTNEIRPTYFRNGGRLFVEPNFIYTVAQNRLLYGTHLIKIDTKFNRKYRVGLLEPWGYKFVEPNFLYVSDPPNNRLYVLDTRTDAIIDSVTTGPYPTEIISGE